MMIMAAIDVVAETIVEVTAVQAAGTTPAAEAMSLA